MKRQCWQLQNHLFKVLMFKLYWNEFVKLVLHMYGFACTSNKNQKWGKQSLTKFNIACKIEYNCMTLPNSNFARPVQCPIKQESVVLVSGSWNLNLKLSSRQAFHHYHHIIKPIEKLLKTKWLWSIDLKSSVSCFLTIIYDFNLKGLSRTLEKISLEGPRWTNNIGLLLLISGFIGQTMPNQTTCCRDAAASRTAM